MSNFYKTSWEEQYKSSQTSIIKRFVYLLTRPLISSYASRYLSPKLLKTLQPSLVLTGRGMPLEDRRLWGAKRCNIRESTILVQGTGTGWDVISWAELKPKKIFATDLYNFEESWREISKFCQNVLSVDVEFHRASLEDHSFLADSSIDLCASDAVFEHCLDLKSVLTESFRVLKPQGSLYASYGPLWFAAGGDHFSGRGGICNSFNHLLLNQDEFKKYFNEFLLHNEDFQSGGRYIELDLFSKLSTVQYCNMFNETGFEIDSLILLLSPLSLLLKKKHPDIFLKLQSKLRSKCDDGDFLIDGNLIRLTKVVPD